MSEAKSTSDTESLFQPFSFGPLELKNRFVMAPMTRSKSPGKIPGEDVAAYYRRRAEGGVGLIITEGTNPPHAGAAGHPDVPAFYGDDALAGWKRVAEEVHDAGGRIVPQLWHVGSVRQKGMEPDPEVPGYGPSAVVHPSIADKGGEPPIEMSQQDIDDVISAFAKAAADSKALGFDGVELHGAHSYLIDQFFWARTNQRTDIYGGDLVQRTRFGVEIIRAVREAVGSDYPIIFRFSQWKQGEYHHKMAKDPDELREFLTPLSEAGVDIFHASTRRFDEPEFKSSHLNLAGWTRELTGKPAITVGSVGLDIDFLHSFAGKDSAQTNIDALKSRMDAGEFDLVAVGRALISDPAWVNKVREGRLEDITAFEREHLADLL